MTQLHVELSIYCELYGHTVWRRELRLVPDVLIARCHEFPRQVKRPKRNIGRRALAHHIIVTVCEGSEEIIYSWGSEQF